MYEALCHVKSFGAGLKQFAKASKNAANYTTGAAAAAAPASNDDDDDLDLFDSEDEEESEEKKRITEERLKAIPRRNPIRQPLLLIPLFFSMSRLGMMRPTWMRCSRTARPLRWTAFSGGPASWSQWVRNQEASADVRCRGCQGLH